MDGKTSVLLIQTPEGIVFPLLLAGPVTRFLAWTLDTACVTLFTIIIGIFLTTVAAISSDIAMALVVFSYFAVSVGYPIATEWFWRGQTLGKRVLRLRVMDAGGMRLQFSQVVIRNLLRFVDGLPAFYAVGGLFCFFNRNAQRLGDVAANTIVVRNPKVGEPDLAQLASGKYNSFRDYPHLAARLRQRVSPQEAGIAMQSLLRRDRLDASARMSLFGDIAAHMKGYVEFPPEASDGLTDEQYVRNVVDILFRKS
jgi:uncharacterized RDD family membrane protein YckC